MDTIIKLSIINHKIDLYTKVLYYLLVVLEVSEKKSPF